MGFSAAGTASFSGGVQSRPASLNSFCVMGITAYDKIDSYDAMKTPLVKNQLPNKKTLGPIQLFGEVMNHPVRKASSYALSVIGLGFVVFGSILMLAVNFSMSSHRYNIFTFVVPIGVISVSFGYFSRDWDGNYGR